LDHIILCPRNDEVYNINEAIFQQFNPNAEVHMLRSVDSVSEEDGIYHAYPAEFLQQLNAGRLPLALLCLKVGSSVILLRNLDPGEGLCNGTRMVVLNVRRKVLQCRFYYVNISDVSGLSRRLPFIMLKFIVYSKQRL